MRRMFSGTCGKRGEQAEHLKIITVVCSLCLLFCSPRQVLVQSSSGIAFRKFCEFGALTLRLPLTP
ncbi:hypothetical protein E2C01_096989 [Portunus trituberculatus]|uniref:Uncharacterized protein n=1 Tax=Portunus trituberculatus TaxID=210409 RepID=A0A5B7K8S2_PORTR|nr:hypothetical protein [Portunus trituberculatus]